MISQETITLACGNGGRLMHELIAKLALNFSNPVLDERADAAEFRIGRQRLAFSTDSYVVKPLFFPGGDIGKLAVFGTVNDLCMKGARPLFLSLAFILEEGLEASVLDKVCLSVKEAARRAKVRIVTGDIKVVEKGSADKIFINTSGVGLIDYKGGSLGLRAKRNDAILINGGIAEHGVAVFEARERMGFVAGIKSDCRNLNADVARCLACSGRISFLRDVTRGGLATTLNEIAGVSEAGIEVYEKDIPIKPSVKKICDVLGFDPLYIASEGKFVCCVDEKDALKVKKAMGRESRIIGRVDCSRKKEVRLRTRIGATRLLPMLEWDQLPRIC